MAYVFRPVYGSPQQQQDENKQNLIHPSDTAAATSVMGSSGGGSNTFSSPQQSGTSGYVDVGSYLDANKDASANFASNLGQQVSNEGQKIQSNINAASQDFQGKVNQGTVNYDHNLIWGSDPVTAANNPDTLAKYRAQVNATYSGPQNFSSTVDIPTLQAQISEFNPKVNAPSQSQIQDIIKQYNPNATRGALTLDQMLLTQDPNAWNKYTEETSKYSGLSDYLNNIQKQNDDLVKTAKDTTAATKTQANKDVDNIVGQFQNALNSEVSTARNTANANINNAKNMMYELPNMPTDYWNYPTSFNANYTPTLKNTLNTTGYKNTLENILGMDQSKYGQLYNLISTLKNEGKTNYTPAFPFNYLTLKNGSFVDTSNNPFYSYNTDLNNYLSLGNPDVDINVSNVANSDEYAKARALESLTGRDLSGILDANASDAASADLTPLNFDYSKAISDLQKTLNADDQRLIDYEKTKNADMSRVLNNSNNTIPSNVVRNLSTQTPSSAAGDFERDVLRAALRQGLVSSSLLPSNNSLGFF